MKKWILLISVLNIATGFSQDRLFTYTYQSNVLTSGQKEIEVWNTFRTGKNNYYSRLDSRAEFEIGLSSRLQTAFYLNYTSGTSATGNNSQLTLETENEISFSNEWKLKLLDPVADPVGLAAYFEYELGSKEYDLEGKLIFDKRINKLTMAANTVYELEYVPFINEGKTQWEKEHKLDLDLALAWSFKPKFALTLESTFRNVLVDGELEHSALYAGPGFSISREKYWINFTVLPQIVSFKGQTMSTLNLNEFEKIQFRLLFSYVL